MRIIFGIIFFLILFSPLAFSESMDDFSEADKLWDNQQSVNVEEYDQVIEALEEKKEQREEKSWRKKLKKFGGGTSLHKEINPRNEITEIEDLKPEDGVLVNIPVVLQLENCILEKGFYKASGMRIDGKIYVEFYQSQFLKGKIEVIETNEDYGEEELNFAKILPHNDSYVKFIYGSLDFNAYAYIPFSGNCN